MDYGSLYDLLHNETMIIEGGMYSFSHELLLFGSEPDKICPFLSLPELLLPILRDICQGVRFLHAAVPQIIHGKDIFREFIVRSGLS